MSRSSHTVVKAMAFVRRAVLGYSKFCETRPVVSSIVSTGFIFSGGDLLTQICLPNNAETSKDGTQTSKSSIPPIDVLRLGNIFAYGSGVLGPFLGLWYTQILPRMVSGSSSNKIKIAKMVVFDQIFESVFADASYIFCVKFMEVAERPMPEKVHATRPLPEVLRRATTRRTSDDDGNAVFTPKQDEEKESHTPLERAKEAIEKFEEKVEVAERAAWEELKDKFLGIYETDLMVWPAIQLANFTFMPSHLQAPVVALCSVGWGAYLSWASR